MIIKNDVENRECGTNNAIVHDATFIDNGSFAIQRMLNMAPTMATLWTGTMKIVPNCNETWIARIDKGSGRTDVVPFCPIVNWCGSNIWNTTTDWPPNVKISCEQVVLLRDFSYSRGAMIESISQTWILKPRDRCRCVTALCDEVDVSKLARKEWASDEAVSTLLEIRNSSLESLPSNFGRVSRYCARIRLKSWNGKVRDERRTLSRDYFGVE